MAFGKRQSGVGATAQALNVDMAAASGPAITETAQPTGSPIRWFLVFIACAAMLYGLFASYGPNLVRDHRLSGTWQPAYDLRASDGECKRTNFVITFCSAKIRSVARPDLAPTTHRFFMLFSGAAARRWCRCARPRTARRSRSTTRPKQTPEPDGVVRALGRHPHFVRLRRDAGVLARGQFTRLTFAKLR